MCAFRGWWLLLALLWSGLGWSMNPDRCFQVTEVRRGTECGKQESIALRCRNVCDQPVDRQACLERGDGKWNCGVNFKAKPGEEACLGAYVCDGMGKYRLWGRVNGRVPFPDAHGTFRQQGEKLYSVASGETRESGCARAQAPVEGGGTCDCEAADDSGQNFRCRVEAALPSQVNPKEVKPFKPGHFLPRQEAETWKGSWSMSGESRDATCAQLHQLAKDADSPCDCQERGRTWICTLQQETVIAGALDEKQREQRRQRMEAQKAHCDAHPGVCKRSSGVRD